jgi:NAD(P)-dependent dehydrogenase (short-subunit alcohol dehydrogenase family)
MNSTADLILSNLVTSNSKMVRSTFVTKLDSIKSAVEFIIQEEGRIDILINNAGAGFNKTTEQATDEVIQLWSFE